MAGPILRPAVLLVGLALAGWAAAHPDLFVDSIANGCLDHPTKSFGTHPAPTPDLDTTFAVSDVQGNRVNTLCPGATYKLTVKFGTARQALVTTTLGSFAPTDPQCPGRWVFSDDPASSIATAWVLPCNATGTAQLKCTSAAGSRKEFRSSSAALPVADAAMAACTTLSSACRRDSNSSSVGAAGGRGAPQLDAAALARLGLPAATSRQGQGGSWVVWPGLPEFDRGLMQILHNILMIASFALLMPLGVLLARHKWMFGLDPRTGMVSASWYFVHMGCQMLAIICALGGVVVITLAYGWRSYPHQLYEPHKWIGLVVIGMVLLQLLAAFVRPKVASPPRRWWNALHKGWGRLTVAAGAANAVVGCLLLHDLKDESLLYWLLPTACCLGVLTGGAVLLEAFKLQYQRTHRYDPWTHQMRHVLDVRAIKDDRPRFQPRAQQQQQQDEEDVEDDVPRRRLGDQNIVAANGIRAQHGPPR